MAFDPIKLRVLASQKEDENWKFRQFLKQYDVEVEELDKQVFELTKDAWAGIDCTTCANCCKEVKPTFSEEEIDRLARGLGMKGQQFVETYLEKAEGDSDKPWQTRSKPCPFLKNNRCSVYEDRPADCRGYPYLYEPRFVSRTMNTISHTSICPIVFEVMEELKRSVGFSRGKRR